MGRPRRWCCAPPPPPPAPGCRWPRTRWTGSPPSPPPLPTPWPAAARDTFVDLLGTGPAAVPVLEALDQAGLLVRLIPEWARVRSKPQRNPVHRFTVDRHLVETAAQAAALTRTVARPDLLLLGALLHDIGKGWPGDHTDAGVAVVRRLGPPARPHLRGLRDDRRDGPPPPAAAGHRDPPGPGRPGHRTVRGVRCGLLRRPARPAARTVHRGRSGHRSGGVVGVEGRPGRRARRPGPGQAVRHAAAGPAAAHRGAAPARRRRRRRGAWRCGWTARP